jgi:prepilin-type N-terminal cleavage/methylation domain-containing protein
MKFIRGTRRFGYSLIEISIAMAILLILVFLLLGVLERVRAQGRSVVCLTNLRSLGDALRQFQNDNNRTLPLAAAEGSVWITSVLPYMQSPTLLVCPDFKPTGSLASGQATGMWYPVFEPSVVPPVVPTLTAAAGGWVPRTEGSVTYQAMKTNSVYPKIYFYFESPTGEIDWSGAVTEHRFKIELVTPSGEVQTVVNDAVQWAWYARNTTYRLGPFFNASVADFKVQVSLPNPSYVWWVHRHSDGHVYRFNDSDESVFRGPQAPPSGSNTSTLHNPPVVGAGTGAWIWNEYITPYRIRQRVRHDADTDYTNAIWTLYINDTGIIGEPGMNSLPIGFSTLTPGGSGIASITVASSTNMTTISSSYGFNYLAGPTSAGPYTSDQVGDHTILIIEYPALVAKSTSATVTGLTATLSAPPPNIPHPHPGKRVNLLFHNGRVESLEPSKIPLTFWTPQAED